MSSLRLTRNGIFKLTRLQGKFCECDVIIQVLVEDHPTDVDEPMPIQEYNAIVSDATYCFPAIVNDFEASLTLGINVVRVVEALCCFSPSGQSILVINRLKPVSTSPTFDFCFPHRVWSSDYDASRGNSLPLTVLRYFPEIEQIPRIRVLVTYKSVLNDPRDYRFEPGFLVHLLDESDELRAYAKNQVALDLYDKLETGKVYYITNIGKFNRGNEFFFNLPNLDSLELTRFTVIEECHDSSVPKLRFNLTSLPKLRGYNLDYRMPSSLVYADVIGVLQTVSHLQLVPIMSIYPRKTVPKREVVIFDQSGQKLLVVLWSYNAEEFRARPGTIVAFRHARPLEGWDGISLSKILPATWGVSSSHLTSDGGRPRLLSVMTTSTVHIEPDIEECFALRQWYNSNPQLLAAPSPQTADAGLCEPDK